MAQHEPGDLCTSDVMEGDTADEPPELALYGQLEEASHMAHSIACFLSFLVTICTTRRGPSLWLRTVHLAAGMHELAEAVCALEDQLDDLPIPPTAPAGAQVLECSCIAMRVAGLMRLVSDTLSEPCLQELELDVEHLSASLQFLAGRMLKVEAGLEQIERHLRRSHV
jgi:hypothetical protein